MPLPTSQSSSRRSDPPLKWGTACAQCKASKARCVRPATPGFKCERCQRLRKECTERADKPRKRRENKPSRTALLEQRLELLIKSLSDPHTTSPISGEVNALRGRVDVASPGKPSLAFPDIICRQTVSPEEACVVPLDRHHIYIPASYNSSGPPSCICRPPPGQVPTQVESDDALLNVYREELTSAHPFVVIRDDVLADVLGTARPFLMSCIRMVASFRSLRSMQGQMYELKQQISDRVLLRSERSLDLLSGLVVMLGWYQHHCLVHTQLNNFVALATTMVADMRLNRKPGWLERTKLMVNDLENVEERTNEQKRLLLGAWYLSSCVSTGLDATECTPLTAYMRQCLKEVEADAECESDILLVYLVKLQDILDRTARLSRQINDEDEDETPKGPVKAPFSAYVTALTAEFDALLNKMPSCVKNDDNMRIRINSVRIRLHEPPKLSADVLLSMSRYFAETPPAGLPSPLDSLYRSHSALKTWYNDWLSMPAATNRTTPMPVVLDAITAITALGRWAKMAAPGSIPRTPVTDALPLDPSGNWNNRSSTTPASSASAGGYLVPSPFDPESDLVQAIATLKTRLATQPDLRLDVTEILGQLGQAMEQASAALAADSEDPPGTGHDWWSLSAIKIRIAQVKLEHWTAMIEDQESETGDEDGYDVDGAVGDRVTTLDQADKPSDDLELLGDMSTQEAGWASTASTGVFDSLGWMEGLGDWGAFMTHLR